MAKMTKEELAAIRERNAKAIDDPWYAPDCEGSGTVITGDGDQVCECMCLGNEEEDADYIAAARRDLPKLLAHIDALQSELDENRWRYVEDGELPEVHEEVFWTRKKGSVIVGTRFNQMHIECEERMHALSEMRAWRPLPKPAPEREPQCPG